MAKTCGIVSAAFLGSTPLLFFPESTITNGRVGILKFSCQAFKIGVPIQPVSCCLLFISSFLLFLMSCWLFFRFL